MINNLTSLIGLKGLISLSETEAFEVKGGARRRRRRRHGNGNHGGNNGGGTGIGTGEGGAPVGLPIAGGLPPSSGAPVGDEFDEE
jgi:hypothetical protein